MIEVTEIDVVRNMPKNGRKPVLSVLIPYYNDDAGELLTDLIEQAPQDKSVEILIYDDGTGDAEINAGLVAIAKNATTFGKRLFLKILILISSFFP